LNCSDTNPGTIQCFTSSTAGGIADCIDPNTNQLNCGTCGHACASGETCHNGQCQTAGQQCQAEGGTICGRNCLTPEQLKTDPNNCGACGVICNQGTCENGICKTTSCPQGTTRCATAPGTGEAVCRDLMNDPDHCGACFFSACATGANCVSGTCKCPEGQEVLEGSCIPICSPGTHHDLRFGTTCVPNCPGNQVNTAPSGACGCPTLPGGTLLVCGDMCVDTNTDTNNCGTCGNACTSGQTCQSGSCQCTSGQQLCNGQCVDPTSFQSDPNNCGTCGNACTSGQTCQSGSCQCPTDQELFNNQCVPKCTGDLKRDINTGQCVCPTLPGGTSTQCGDKCAYTNTNKDNCGACGNACTSGQSCTSGVCTCPSGQHLVNGICENLDCGPDTVYDCGVGPFCVAKGCTFDCPKDGKPGALNCKPQ